MTQNIPEHNNIWSATLRLLEMKIPKASFETWLKDTFVLSSSNNVLTIGVSSLFVSEWLNKKMKFQIESAIKEVSSVKTKVLFTVAKKKQPRYPTTEPKPKRVLWTLDPPQQRL